MPWLFSPPSMDDLIRLLKAWRFWSVGALIGALLGTAFYYLAPPPYRAHAIVLVDFNLEQAWPEETDRQQFYYLERETRKLQEIAWSDLVLGLVAEDVGKIFCLVDAPDPDTAHTVHREAHGLVADEIYEVQEGS